MRHSLGSAVAIGLLLIAHGATASALTVNRAGQQSVTCQEAVKRAHRVKVGMKKAEVLDLLGPPTSREAGQWSYDFGACAHRPRPGEQVILGVTILFAEGVVSDVKWAWIDAIGPPPTAPKAKPGRKH